MSAFIPVMDAFVRSSNAIEKATGVVARHAEEVATNNKEFARTTTDINLKQDEVMAAVTKVQSDLAAPKIHVCKL